MRDEIREKILTPDNDYNEVNLIDTDITDDEIEEIAEFIVEKRSDVESVLLGNNQLGDKGAIILCEILKNLNNLSLLEIENNQIDTQGITALFKLERDSPNLRVMLGGNKMYNKVVLDQIIEEVFKTPRP